MSRAATVAAGVFALTVGAMAAALAMWATGVREPFTPDLVLFPVAYLAFAGVGALVVARRPDNAIGRLSLAAGVAGSAVALADSYARLTGLPPGQPWAAWIAAVGFPTTLGLILFTILLFPSGRLASPRWRIVAGLVAVGTLFLALGNAFTPAFADYVHPNPLAVDAFDESPLDQGGVGWILVLMGAVLAGLGLVPRLRRASGVERQQLKWITFAAGIHGASWIVLALDLPGTAGLVARYLLFATLTLIPVSAGFAILRYRLYEIDLVIRRTVVYAVVVAVLGAIYVGLIVAMGTLLSGLTGSTTLPVALSTLAIAALFAPVRARVRTAVDRRFYRSRYDAQRTLEQFTAMLRDEVELDSVARVLVDVAARTVRPTAAAVWIRPKRP